MLHVRQFSHPVPSKICVHWLLSPRGVIPVPPSPPTAVSIFAVEVVLTGYSHADVMAKGFPVPPVSWGVSGRGPKYWSLKDWTLARYAALFGDIEIGFATLATEVWGYWLEGIILDCCCFCGDGWSVLEGVKEVFDDEFRVDGVGWSDDWLRSLRLISIEKSMSICGLCCPLSSVPGVGLRDDCSPWRSQPKPPVVFDCCTPGCFCRLGRGAVLSKL